MSQKWTNALVTPPGRLVRGVADSDGLPPLPHLRRIPTDAFRRRAGAGHRLPDPGRDLVLGKLQAVSGGEERLG